MSRPGYGHSYEARDTKATARLAELWADDTERAVRYSALLGKMAWAGGMPGTGGGERPAVSRWRRIRSRIRSWWDSHRPTIHLGPCDHEDCY